MIRKSRQEILEQLPENGSRGLAQRILKYKEQYDKRSRKFPEREQGQTFDPNSRARQLREGRENFTSSARDVEVVRLNQVLVPEEDPCC